MQGQHIVANGGRHYVEVEGEGPALVLIPGFTLDTRMWDEQAEPFARRYRVVRYDLRAAGRSDPPNGRYAFHEDLKAILNALGIQSAHICGLSLGGGIAVDFALAYPAMTRSLIPVDASVVGGYPWPSELNAWFATMAARASAGDIEGAKAYWLSTEWFAPAMAQPAVAAKLRAMLADYSGWHFANKNPVSRLEPPASTRLNEIAAPTLVIVGERDLSYYNLLLAERLASGIPNARKLVLEGVGHMANMEDPERFNAAVLAFLDELEDASA